MKTQNAFALQNFDKMRIFQRPILKKFVQVDGEFFLKNDLRDDEEIIRDLLTIADDVRKNETNLRKLQELQKTLIHFQARMIDRQHLPRLVRFKRATENTELKKRADELRDKYDEDASQILITATWIKKELEGLEKVIQQQNRNIFAKRLKQARNSAGFTQKELAMALDMTQGGYVSYEIARREPPLTTLKRLTSILNKSADWLLGISPN